MKVRKILDTITGNAGCELSQDATGVMNIAIFNETTRFSKIAAVFLPLNYCLRMSGQRRVGLKLATIDHRVKR
jgi:hypothetical protein